MDLLFWIGVIVIAANFGFTILETIGDWIKNICGKLWPW